MNGMQQHAMDLMKRANPVRADALESWTTGLRSPRAVADEIKSTRPPASRRLLSHSPGLALPALAVAAVALVLATSVLSGGPENALAIDRTDQFISLRIEDESASAQRMNRELRERDIDVEVQLVPVPPDEVGQWVGGRAVWPGVPANADQHRLGDERIRELNEAARGRELTPDPDDPTTYRVPLNFKGHFLLYAGREAKPGEQLWINGNPPGAR